MTAIPKGLRRVQILAEDAALILAGLVLLAMGAIIVASILGRVLFLRPLPDDLLLVGLLNVAVITLPLAHVERMRGHIAVTVTTDWLGTRAKGALRAFGAFAMAVFFGGIGFMILRRMRDEIAKGAYYDGVLQIPTWPMKAVFGLAITLFFLRLLVSIAQGIHTAVTGLDEDAPASAHEEI